MLFLVALVLGLCNPSLANGDLDFGINQAEKVAKGVCWGEKYTNPLTKCWIFSDYAASLLLNQNYLRDTWNGPGPLPTKEHELIYIPGWLEGTFKMRVDYYLPGYESCIPFSKAAEIHSEPAKDYGWFLGDSDVESYPYKSFVHCLLEVMEDRNGMQALDALKSHWENPKTLEERMLEVQNSQRELHGVPPLEIDSELTERAQRWADYLVERCAMIHIFNEKPGHEDLTYKGQRTGECLGENMFLNNTDEEVGLDVTAQFYSEVELYPWPAYDGDFTDELYPEIGHFTQTVWKETSLVGYAIARGTTCKTMYVVVRYWPIGNVMHTFEKSVFPKIN